VEEQAQANLLRCIFGLFNSARSVPASILAWNGGTVVRLAEAIYEERSFERLPIFADALEEAGCTDHAILDHCRQDQHHARGCWVLDLILGK
jgi:hypothetical protein